ncbi:MAG: adenylate/guanylate cyclase domain-containing protein [Treponema bryantii]|nr:adenylate/guanylate cyclase domain-containing protein [Treponema bryantii]
MSQTKFRVFQRVGKTKIIPIGLKILLIFICLILLSNFATNIITIQLSQNQIIKLNNQVMVEQLKELYNSSSNQYQIYTYSNNIEECETSLKQVAKSGFTNPNSIALAVKKDGTIDFYVSNNELSVWDEFIDSTTLQKITSDTVNGIYEGSISFKTAEEEYFGVYKFQDDWDYFLIRAENRSDLDDNNKSLYLFMFIFVIALTTVFVIIGILVIRHEFKSVRTITNDLYNMQKNKKLELIDLSNSTNDDITYLAASFNSLSSSVNNLLNTFQKFVSKDVVAKAYSEQTIALEGSQRELVMLFSDIRSFTYRTETLGNDIIDVLNVHYNRVIHKVHENTGVVGSIIGDAILAIYGTLDAKMSKSYNSIRSAWDITKVTANLREAMIQKRIEVEKKRSLTESEERVYQAVLLDVGVGIDGGNVFYGNIGSNEHMANTVIGDNVNSASRLEGLTRVYHLPVIVSEYIKDEVLKESARYKFIEIDTVQVKGKTEGKKIFFPLDTNETDELIVKKYSLFEDGLSAYYNGDWKSARKLFKDCELEVSQVFIERMGNKNAPEDWNGIWTMTSK